MTDEPTEAKPRGHQNAAIAVGVIAAASWGYTAFTAAQNQSDISDIADSAFIDASAIQISQLADQALIEVLPLAAASAGLTAVMMLLLGLSALKRLAGRTRRRAPISPRQGEAWERPGPYGAQGAKVLALLDSDRDRPFVDARR